MTNSVCAASLRAMPSTLMNQGTIHNPWIAIEPPENIAMSGAKLQNFRLVRM